MSKTGWIKLHRKLRDWEWISEPSTLCVWIHILLSANYEQDKFMGHVIPVGSFATGIHSLSEKTGLSVSKIRTSLKRLENSKQIAIKTTNKFSIISIVNWSDYQRADKQMTNGSQTDDKRIATSKEVKKERKLDADDARAENFQNVDMQNHVTVGKHIAQLTGWDADPNWFGDYSRVQTWLAQGWNPELDIYPVVKRLMGKRNAKSQGAPKTLNYFEQAIADAFAQRNSPLPQGDKNHASSSSGGRQGRPKPTQHERIQAAKRQALAELGVEEGDC